MRTTILILLIFTVSISNKIYSQNTDYTNNSVRTGFGFGINEGTKETGTGLLYNIGWNKTIGEKQRLRLNPNVLFGVFSTEISRGIRDQYYRTSSYELNMHYDLIKYKSLSLVGSIGGFMNFSRGLLGTGGDPEATEYTKSEYFYSLYFGGNASVAIRINPKNSRIAYEIRPLNIQYGNNRFMLTYFMFGMDFKFKK